MEYSFHYILVNFSGLVYYFSFLALELFSHVTRSSLMVMPDLLNNMNFPKFYLVNPWWFIITITGMTRSFNKV